MTEAGNRTVIVKHAITVLFGRGIIRVSQFVAFLLLARLLTPAEFGWFGILTTAMTLAAMLGSLGLRQSIAFKIGQGHLSSGEALGSGLLLWPILVLISVAVVFGLYGNSLPGIPTPLAGGIITCGIGSAIMLMFFQGQFLGEGSIGAFSLSESIPRVTLMAAVTLLAISGAVRLDTALWAHVGGFAVALPVAAWVAYRGRVRLSVRLSQLGGMLRYGSIFAFNLLLITLITRISMFVIEHYWGAAEAGEFYAAIRVFEIFLEVAAAFGMVLFSNSVRQSTSSSVVERDARISCWMFWLFALIGVCMALAAPFVVAVLIGNQYRDAGSLLQILALSLAPAAACKVIYPSLAGSGRPGFGSPVIVICLVVSLTVALTLVPAAGANGGAVAVAVGQYVLLAGYIATCRIRLNIPMRDFLLPRMSDVRLIGKAMLARVRKYRRRI